MRLDPQTEGHLRAALATLEMRLSEVLLAPHPQPMTEADLRRRIAVLRAQLSAP